ncbi:MAG TPA: hypothetical protein VJH71_02280 [Candidatus Paceibacterota bacterium]
MYKKSILLIFVGLAACLFWFWVQPWLASPVKFANAGVWIRPLVMLCVLSAFVGLALLLINNKLLRIVVSILVGLPPVLIYGYNHFFLLALLALVLLHLQAVKQIHIQEKGRIKIDVGEIMRHGLPVVIMPIFIMISFAFFLSPALQGVAKQGELPPTVNQVLNQVISGFVGQELSALPPSERLGVESQLVNEVMNKFNELLGPYFVFMPPVLAFGLFIILQGLSFIFVWLGMLVAMLVFWIMRKVGFVKIKTASVEAEVLEV